jgi:hypothetical protein
MVQLSAASSMLAEGEKYENDGHSTALHHFLWLYWLNQYFSCFSLILTQCCSSYPMLLLFVEARNRRNGSFISVPDFSPGFARNRVMSSKKAVPFSRH